MQISMDKLFEDNEKKTLPDIEFEGMEDNKRKLPKWEYNRLIKKRI